MTDTLTALVGWVGVAVIVTAGLFAYVWIRDWWFCLRHRGQVKETDKLEPVTISQAYKRDK